MKMSRKMLYHSHLHFIPTHRRCAQKSWAPSRVPAMYSRSWSKCWFTFDTRMPLSLTVALRRITEQITCRMFVGYLQRWARLSQNRERCWIFNMCFTHLYACLCGQAYDLPMGLCVWVFIDVRSHDINFWEVRLTVFIVLFLFRFSLLSARQFISLYCEVCWCFSLVTLKKKN